MRSLLLILLLLPTSVIAQVPPLSARINDYAGLLSTSTAARLEKQLAAFEQQDGTQLVLLTVPDLQGLPIDQYSLNVAEKWKIGEKGRDNGALLLITKKERKIRIETGYGLKNSLTDLRSGRIIREIITPYFAKGDFDTGIAAGLEAMINTVNGEYNAVPHKSNADAGELQSFASFMLVILLAMGNIFRKKKAVAGLAGAIAAPFFGLLFFDMEMPLLLLLIPGGFFLGFIASLMSTSMTQSARSGSRRYRHSYRSGRSGGGFRGNFGHGGGFSGGGGSFGGGGASGGW